MSFKMPINANEYLRKTKIYTETALKQPKVFGEASTELASMNAKLNALEAAPKTADEKRDELTAITKTFEKARNKAETAKTTVQGSRIRLTEVEHDLRTELAKDPKNKALVSGGLVDYKHLISGEAINNTSLSAKDKDALKKAVALITEARAACDEVEVAARKVKGTEKDPEKIEVKTKQVSTSIDIQKEEEVRSVQKIEEAQVTKAIKEGSFISKIADLFKTDNSAREIKIEGNVNIEKTVNIKPPKSLDTNKDVIKDPKMIAQINQARAGVQAKADNTVQTANALLITDQTQNKGHSR
jgi:hypothetical protein